MFCTTTTFQPITNDESTLNNERLIPGEGISCGDLARVNAGQPVNAQAEHQKAQVEQAQVEQRRNANTWAEKYEALKQLSENVDINKLKRSRSKQSIMH
jgi:hypothetical protein